MTIEGPTKRRFRLVLIKPSHYDDDGYVISWWRSSIPSNSLAAVYTLAEDAARRWVLGPDVDLDITAIDETNTRVKVYDVITLIRRQDGYGMATDNPRITDNLLNWFASNDVEYSCYWDADFGDFNGRVSTGERPKQSAVMQEFIGAEVDPIPPDPEPPDPETPDPEPATNLHRGGYTGPGGNGVDKAHNEWKPNVSPVFETSADDQFSGFGAVFHWDSSNQTLYFSADGTTANAIAVTTTQNGVTLTAHDLIIV